MEIRPASIETDLPDIARIINPYEDIPVTVDQIRSYFLFNPPGRIQRRLVAVGENNRITGTSGFVHEASAPADFFNVWVIIDPAFRHRGIGSALWNVTLEALQEQNANRLEADIFDNDPVALGFAGRRGFNIDHHAFYSALNLADFDETPYLPAISALAARGIRICSLASYPDTPEIRRKFYELNHTLSADIPNEEGHHVNFPEFEKYVFEAPWFRREGQLLAVDGEFWVGLAAISLNPETQSAYNVVTGVLAAYRERKIAQALKIMATRYARQHGARSIGTDNDSTNAPMLAINRKMGYQPQPGKYGLVCWLRGRDR